MDIELWWLWPALALTTYNVLGYCCSFLVPLGTRPPALLEMVPVVMASMKGPTARHLAQRPGPAAILRALVDSWLPVHNVLVLALLLLVLVEMAYDTIVTWRVLRRPMPLNKAARSPLVPTALR